MPILTCDACGESVPVPDEPASPRELPHPRCDCGEPRWFATDTSGLADRSWPTDLDDRMWSFPWLLPVDPPETGIEAAANIGTATGSGAAVGIEGAVGGTPLVRTPALDEFAGARIWIKDESGNPTGSFKDRGSVVGVRLAAAAGAETVGTVSHGNMAISMAATATAFGLDCVVCVPADIPESRLGHIARFDPRILRIEGDYGRLYRETLALGPEHGIPFVNSDTPGRVAGQKTTVLELLAGYRRRTGGFPDAIVVPTSSGGHASGIVKGLRELHEAGLIGDEEVPRLYLVQAAACAPVARADERGSETVESVERGETIAYSIANPDPPSGTRALRGTRATGGGALAVDDDEIRSARRRLAVDAGLAVELSAATSLAGVRRLIDRETVTPSDDVVCVTTGTGFTDPPDDVSIEVETVPISALPDALRHI